MNILYYYYSSSGTFSVTGKNSISYQNLIKLLLTSRNMLGEATHCSAGSKVEQYTIS